MRDKVSLLVIPFLVLTAAGCQGSDGDGVDAEKSAGKAAKESAPAVLGAPPASRAPRVAGADLPEVPAYSAYLAEPTAAPAAGSRAATRDADVAAVQAHLTRQAPGMVASVDARRPVPSFLFAARSAARKAGPAGARARQLRRADQAAFSYLDQYRGAYQLDRAALATAEVAAVHDTGRGGRIVQLGQRIDDREVFGTRMSFLLDSDLDLVAIGGHLHGQTAAAWSGSVDGRAALARVIADVVGGAVDASALAVVAEDGGRHTTRFAGTSSARFHLPQPALVREVFYALPKTMVPAFQVAVEVSAAGSRSSRAYQYVISSSDGRILERQNRTFSEARDYSVWADNDGELRPIDGPQGDLTPHPTGNPNDPVPVENVAARIVASIESLSASGDAWLPDGATDLRPGNNVSAYADHREPDGFGAGDIVAAQNAQGDFSFNYNPAAGPVDTTPNVRTAITQLFFVNNWLHDYWYDSGFDEASGNAQLSNLGRGGEEGDPILAEAQDTRGEVDRNNANMSTPPDGLSPRMQMYLFDGPITPIGETSFEVTAPADIAGTYPVQGSSFGVDALVDASAQLQLVNDGVVGDPGGTVDDGCEPFAVTAGRIAVVRRGFCGFLLKAQLAEAAGASGVLVINTNVEGPDALPPMGGVDTEIPVGIPAVGISFANGNLIADAIGGGAVSADMTRAGRDRDIDRDGTIDNAVVSHEWGHYLHHRLTLCGSAQCGAMSEGWGDFVALHTLLRDGDDLDATFGLAAWATNNAYFGIRRAPYSTTFEVNPLTFGMIADDAVLPPQVQVFGPNSEVHNAGEVWSSMLFEVYVALLQDPSSKSFDDARRRMSQYLVAGMKLAPPNPTFTEQRDAILAAIAAAGNGNDLQVAAEAFARRGAGTGAVSPTVDSFDFLGTVESTVVAGDLAVTGTEVAIDDDCDADTNFDGGESGRLVVTVVNGGPIPLSDSTVTVSEPPKGVTFPDGATATVAALGAYESVDVELAIQLDGAAAGVQTLSITVTAANETSFHPTVDSVLVQRVNFDDSEATSSVDDVESKLTPWTSTSDLPDEIVWSRASDGASMVWHADDPAVPAQQELISPALAVGDEPFVVTFDTRYSFENSDDGTGTIAFWDGGVMEVSTDNGATWADVATLLDPGYGGEMFLGAGNPLGGRQGFVAQSEGFPELSQVSLDFGTQLAGQEVMIRFLVGSDISTGDAGWEVDNLAFAGITNTPFSQVIDDAGSCGTGTDDGADDGADDGTDDGSNDGGGNGDDDDGCGCRSAGASGPIGLLLYAGLVLPFVVRRRRRAAK
ncbi:MAG TPA: M36 family metallopeptidase [Kofleriaceae bacterium]|nr:M36 family metallopeptidase [Kofleriaceae bacterium]